MRFPWDRHKKIPGAAFRLTKETFLKDFETRCRGESLVRIFKANAENRVRNVFFSGRTNEAEGSKPMSALPITNSDNIRPVYSNSVSTNFTQFDIHLAFTEVTPNDKGGANNELKAHVILTPAHARSLAALIAGAVEHYESQFGKVTQPNPPADKPPENALS